MTQPIFTDYNPNNYSTLDHIRATNGVDVTEKNPTPGRIEHASNTHMVRNTSDQSLKNQPVQQINLDDAVEMHASQKDALPLENNKYVVISKALETYEASKDGRMITKQEIDSTESHLVDIVV